jgi:hypothetical protein
MLTCNMVRLVGVIWWLYPEVRRPVATFTDATSKDGGAGCAKAVMPARTANAADRRAFIVTSFDAALPECVQD